MSTKAPKLPAISHLQFLALGVLVAGEQPGRVIREAVASFGARRTDAAFYQLMARLERDELVHGWYGAIRVGDQTVKERRYTATASGLRAWTQTRAFYESVSRAATRREWSNA